VIQSIKPDLFFFVELELPPSAEAESKSWASDRFPLRRSAALVGIRLAQAAVIGVSPAVVALVFEDFRANGAFAGGGGGGDPRMLQSASLLAQHGELHVLVLHCGNGVLDGLGRIRGDTLLPGGIIHVVFPPHVAVGGVVLFPAVKTK